jgi:hypothetical protein
VHVGRRATGVLLRQCGIGLRRATLLDRPLPLQVRLRLLALR